MAWSTIGTVIADFNTTLNLKVAVGATTATLDSATDDDGVALPTGTYFLTLDGGSVSSKEYIKCTLTGTALTAIQSVSRQGALTSGFARTHRKGATVTITDFASIRKIADLLDGTTNFPAGTVLWYDGTATIATANQFATKAYVDGVAIAGSPDSSTTVKGIGRVSVAPVSATIPIFVGDNDGRVPTQDENDALAGTSGIPSSSNKYVTNNDTSTTSTANKVLRLDSGGLMPAGTTSARGAVKLSTDPEAWAKSSTTVAITPSNLAVIAPNNQKFQTYAFSALPTSFSVSHWLSIAPSIVRVKTLLFNVPIATVNYSQWGEGTYKSGSYSTWYVTTTTGNPPTVSWISTTTSTISQLEWVNNGWADDLLYTMTISSIDATNINFAITRTLWATVSGDVLFIIEFEI